MIGPAERLPHQACLSEAQCEGVRRFVAAGGGLVATLETSRYDEEGRSRNEFALGDVFGVSALSNTPHGPVRNAYIRIERREALAQGFEGTAVISAPEIHFCPVKIMGAADTQLTLIPPIPHMPPERAFFRVSKTDTPLALTSNYGRGRAAYFPCDLARMCGAYNNPDHRRLLANAVRWALGAPCILGLNGPGLLDIHLYRQPRRYLIHMVNCTNPNLFRPPATEITPVGAQELTLRLRKGETVNRARLLWRDEEIGVASKDSVATAVVPEVRAYEVVVLELAEPLPCKRRREMMGDTSAAIRSALGEER